MATKTITSGPSKSWGSYIQCKIELSSVPETASNTSDATASIYVRKADHDGPLTIPTEGTWYYSVTVNGSKRSGSLWAPVLESWVLLYSGSWNDIAHGSDGSKSISVSGSVEAPTTTAFAGQVASCSDTFSLDNIPRASSISDAGNVTLGSACNVTWTPKAASFRYKLKFAMGKWSYTTGAIHPNTTSSYTYKGYAISLEAARQIPESATGTMTVTLYTYSDSGATTQVGSASSDTFTVTVPTSAAPTVSMSLSVVHSLPSAFNGIYVQGKSKVRASLSATFHYGTSASYYDVSTGGKTYGSSASYTTDYLGSSGSVSVSGRAVDKRGYAGYNNQTINVIPYAIPKVQNVSVYRCNAEGEEASAGNYIRISATRSYSSVSGKNSCEIRYRYKQSDASSWSSWTTILSAGDTSTNTVTTGALLGNLSEKLSYVVEVQVLDAIGETNSSSVTIPTDKVYQHRAGSINSMGLGKYVSKPNTLDVAWNVTVDGTLRTANLLPISSYDGLDFNELVNATGYYLGSSAPGSLGCSNYPSNVTGKLEVVAGFGFAWQTYTTHQDVMYTRSYYAGSGWTTWKTR